MKTAIIFLACVAYTLASKAMIAKDFKVGEVLDLCKANGEILLHPDSRCKYVECTYGDEPWKDDAGNYKFYPVERDCPYGTGVSREFYGHDGYGYGSEGKDLEVRTLCADRVTRGYGYHKHDQCSVKATYPHIHNQGYATHNTHNVGYNTHNAGYGTHNVGYNTHNAGYNTHNAGYNTHNTHNAGYGTHNTHNAGYGTHNTHNVGYNTHNVGYNTHNVHNTGYGNQGYGTHNNVHQGYNTHNVGYNNVHNTAYPQPHGYADKGFVNQAYPTAPSYAPESESSEEY